MSLVSHSDNFRVVADLGNYFVDHRSRAYILVKDGIKTVSDLQKRISELFKIENFDLCTNGIFLHPLEDVRILSYDEIISLIPSNSDGGVRPFPSQTTNTDSNTKTGKRSLEIIPEESESSSPEKKKRKKLAAQTLSFSSSSEDVPKKKKKCKKQHGEKKSKKQKDRGETTRKKEKALKNKVERVPNSKKNLNNGVGVDTVRLSRQLENTSGFSKYTPIPRCTDKYLAKNKINIVKIDFLETCNTDQNVSQRGSTETDLLNNTNMENNSVEPKIPIKKLIEDFEKLSPENQSTKYNVKEAVEEEAVAEAQKDNTIISVNSASHKNTTEPMEVLNNVEASLSEESCHSSIGPIPPPPPRSIKATAKSISGVGSLLEHLRESDSVISITSDSLDDSVTKRKRIRKRKRKPAKSDKLDDDSQSAFTPLPYVPLPLKTQSCPKMHIKFEDKEENPTVSHSSLHAENNTSYNTNAPATLNGTEPSSSTSYQALSWDDMSPIALAISKTYTPVKGLFLTQNNNQLEKRSTIEAQNSLVVTQNGGHVDHTENSLIADDQPTALVGDEIDHIIEQNKNLIGDEFIEKAFPMHLITPKAGDVIAFKVLRMSEDYTPTVSSYIVGKLQIYDPETQLASFKILRGEDQLTVPTGKLTLNEDEGESKIPNLSEFTWSQLLEPRLIYP